MFVRYRETPSRLQVSLIETRRLDGKVRHEHVASLGSIAAAPDVPDRIVFWARLYERLGKLQNRVGPDALGKILGDIHARVPMVTVDEQRALQLENAKADADQWAAIRELNASTAAGQEEVVAQLKDAVMRGKEGAAEADAKVKAAQERVAAIKRGDAVVGGLGKPTDFAAILKAAGMTKADLDHCRLLALIPKERFDEFLQEERRLTKKSERRLSTRVAREVLRKYAEG
jgi:hypothetical protein